jgi:hypothetical protein
MGKEKIDGSSKKEVKVEVDEEAPALKEDKALLREKKNLIISVALVILIILAAGLFYYFKDRGKVDESAVNMSHVQDLGAVTIRGDGLPGYDIDRDGEADYLTHGFGYYKGLYEAGGFEYGPGGIELEEFKISLTLPVLNISPDEIVESNVGSVVIFNGVDDNSTVEVIVILKTLGPSLTTYNLFIEKGGESYNIFDIIEKNGTGTIEEDEVEVSGRTMFRE